MDLDLETVRRIYLEHLFDAPPQIEKLDSLYLAHPFDSRHEMREWELEFEKRTGINLKNPFYDGGERTDIERADADRGVRYETLDPDELIPRDVGNIAGEDGMVAFVTGDLSYGTIKEMVYAKVVYRKPVLSVVTNGHENHPWLRFHSTELFTDREALERFLVEFRRK